MEEHLFVFFLWGMIESIGIQRVIGNCWKCILVHILCLKRHDIGKQLGTEDYDDDDDDDDDDADDDDDDDDAFSDKTL